jgi:predicted amidophosphoribosyltransferase
MATTNSLSAELKKAGAREITILCLARASLP